MFAGSLDTDYWPVDIPTVQEAVRASQGAYQNGCGEHAVAIRGQSAGEIAEGKCGLPGEPVEETVRGDSIGLIMIMFCANESGFVGILY
jgi:hypothetical protein